eukprot:1544612-Amphidinium_carterae.1
MAIVIAPKEWELCLGSLVRLYTGVVVHLTVLNRRVTGHICWGLGRAEVGKNQIDLRSSQPARCFSSCLWVESHPWPLAKQPPRACHRSTAALRLRQLAGTLKCDALHAGRLHIQNIHKQYVI